MRARQSDPRTLAVADVETSLLRDGEAPRTRFWGLAIEGEDYRRFGTSRDLERFLRARSDSLTILHHHDYDAIQYWLVDRCDYRPDLVVGGRLVQGTSGRHVWQNSYKLFPTSLKAILESAGFAKPDLADLEARNRADTVDALAAFRALARRYVALCGIDPLDGVSRTSAGVGVRAAEAVAGQLPRWTEDREPFYGGRTEALRLGAIGEAECWDIASSYPASFLAAPARDDLLQLEVTVSRALATGPCPFPLRREGKLIFPVGTFTTWTFRSNYERFYAAHSGIARARILRRIPVDLSWVRAVGQDLMAPAYALRAKAKQSDPPMAYVAKILLNSIYGRLAVRSAFERFHILDRVPEGRGYWPIGGGRYVASSKTERESPGNYLFAAWVTDNARARLYDCMRQIPADSLYYCDTDSVFCAPGAFPFAAGKGLGDWNLEGAGQLTVRGLKDYTFRGRDKLKGGRGGIQWTPKRALAGKGARAIERTRREDPAPKREILARGRTRAHEV